MAAGLRVFRGPDWNLNDDDGGEGHVGILVEVGESGHANVTWDGGQVTLCRGGQGLGHDLRILDNATVGIQHPHIVCDECGESGIVGMRWKCEECSDYDLCSLCYFTDKHDCSHHFWRYETPSSQPEKQECRKKSLKMRLLGIFTDAKVTRGMDWEWNDQDGGQGSVGRVLELQTPAAHSARSMVAVEWENGFKNVYRLGYKGKVDLQYVEEAPGIECYPKHLPVFDAEHYSEKKVMENRVSEDITSGDSVVIAVSSAELQQLQKSRSGWAVGMAECMGKVGKVQSIAANGDVNVIFGTKKYRIYPGALKKVGKISTGSHVRILDDEEKVKMLQEGHGGYNSRMRAALGKVGEVIKSDDDGDVVVKFGDRHWVFAPACCMEASGEQVDFISSQDDDGPDGMKIRLDGNQDGLDFMRVLAALAEASGHLAGDVVFLKLLADKEETRALNMLHENPKLAKGSAQGFTALHVAANRGLLCITKALVEGGADLKCKDKDGDTPLLAALSGGSAEVARYLIEKGCDIEAKNSNSQTACHKAALAGFVEILKDLKARGADFNAQDDSEDTPLHDAITKGRVGAAEVILSCPHVDLRRPNKKGHPPLHYACLKDEPEIVELIIQRDRNVVNAQKEDGFTPLHVCACNSHIKCMKILLAKGGATVQVKNNELQTPLHVAAHQASLECTQILMQHGADLNSQDIQGNTPLHLVLSRSVIEDHDVIMLLLGRHKSENEKERLQTAKFLIQNGANHEAKNHSGQTALDVCYSERLKEAIKRFLTDRNDVTSGSISELTNCKQCQRNKADILLVPCGHRALCRKCCSSKRNFCPECGASVKSMFDQNGKKLEEGCTVM